MFQIARMFLSLGGSRLAETRDQIGRRAAFFFLLAVFGLLFLIFGLAAITALLAETFGLAPALAIMSGGAFLCALILLLLMNAAEKRHRARVAEQAELQARLRQLAMLSAVAAAKPKLAHVVGLGVLGAIAILLVTGRGKDEDKA